MSVTEERGFDFNCYFGYHITLRQMLLEASESEDIKEFGFNALVSIRLEKFFGIWSAEFAQG